MIRLLCPTSTTHTLYLHFFGRLSRLPESFFRHSIDTPAYQTFTSAFSHVQNAKVGKYRVEICLNGKILPHPHTNIHPGLVIKDQEINRDLKEGSWNLVLCVKIHETCLMQSRQAMEGRRRIVDLIGCLLKACS